MTCLPYNSTLWLQSAETCQEQLTSNQSGTSAGKPWEDNQQLGASWGPRALHKLSQTGLEFSQSSCYWLWQILSSWGNIAMTGEDTPKKWITGTAADRCIVKALLLALQLLLLTAGSKVFQNPTLQPFPDTLRDGTAHSNCIIRSNATKPALVDSPNSKADVHFITECKTRSTKSSL